MNRRRALGASLATIALGSTLLACTSQTSGGPAPAPAKISCPPNDNDYSWCSNQPGASSAASAPAGGGHSSAKPSPHPTFTGSGPVRFGDWMFGQCSLSLYPAYVGLTWHSSGNLVILASTACVGYQPQEIHIHIALQKWWKPGGAGKSDWHDTGITLADNTKPPLVILPPEGDPPLSQQHQISDAVHCTPNNLSKAIPYRLRIDIVGVSYGGEPIVTGGYGSAFIVSNWDCA